METQNNQVRGIKILAIEDVKVYEVRNDTSETSNLTRGKLFIFYFAEFDRFVLTLNSFEYALSPYLPVMASLTVDRGFRSYVLPNAGGHYILKLKTTPTPAVIKNFETILANYSQFSYERGHEKALEEQANRKADYNMNFDSAYDGKQPQVNLETRKPQPDNFVKAGNAVSVSGEFLKQKLIKAANYIGGQYIEPKTQLITAQNSNQFYVKNIQELKGVSAIDNELVDFKRTLIAGLITLSNQFEREGVTTSTIIKPKVEKQQGTWSDLGNTTLSSAKNVWFGMSEAATILGKAWKSKQAVQNKNPVGKTVQYEKAEPVNRPNPFTKPTSGPSGDYPVSNLREPVQQQAQPYVFYQPKYTQAPVIEKEQDYSDFHDERVNQTEQNLLHNDQNLLNNNQNNQDLMNSDAYQAEEDTGRKNIYPRLDTLNAGTYPSYNPYRVDAKPADDAFARIRGERTEHHEYSHSDY